MADLSRLPEFSIEFLKRLTTPQLAPRYDPWALFYRKGLKEFLAACGVRGPSSSAPPQGGVADEGVGEGGEGPCRIIFDSSRPKA